MKNVSFLDPDRAFVRFSATRRTGSVDEVFHFAVTLRFRYVRPSSDAGNRIFLKPKEDNAATNLTVLTDRRTYSFALQASRSTRKESMTWRLRFEYPEEAARALAREERASLEKASFVNPDAQIQFYPCAL